jgi:hypothetical protein
MSAKKVKKVLAGDALYETLDAGSFTTSKGIWDPVFARIGGVIMDRRHRPRNFKVD